MSRRRRLLLAYTSLLVASHLVPLRAPAPTLPSDESTAELRVVDGDRLGPATIQLAYYDSDPGATRPVLVLIHGSPGSAAVMRPLAGLMEHDFRILAPDLPGFGASTHTLPDYSFRSHAYYLRQLFDYLHIARARVAGFSMGGGVALSLADIEPARVCSIAMISAIGVQEEELTGSYGVNHALHGLQLAVLLGLRHAVPHFGLLDGEGLNVEYARNLFESDQRPLRRILEEYRRPMLILHGAGDRNVPLAAAREHHRLVPRSQLVVLPSNHFMVFQQPEAIAAPLLDFLNDPTNSCEG
jgi:pimeloyl-ACP methyl ester carboxylesterase